jgi:hypothetical protein
MSSSIPSLSTWKRLIGFDVSMPIPDLQYVISLPSGRFAASL